MWLLPAFSVISRLAGTVYYRLEYAGGSVPRTGPVLLVANHPNSLLDPVLVIAAARRRVRFLAKAPLFKDGKVGWLIRGSGAIPVYRRSDDPGQMGRNQEMFQAVFDALSSGSTVGIFPEGLSHSDPTLAPLKTGAARIALGAAGTIGAAFPIVPIGLVFREKDIFRSEALVLVGDPLRWDDLQDRGADDADAVRALTERIDEGLRGVTVNLDAWEDRPTVEAGVAVWETHHSAGGTPSDHVTRLTIAARLLRELRDGRVEGRDVVHDLRRHMLRLNRLRLRPADLGRDTTVGMAFRWAVSRLLLVSLPAVILGAVGFVLFWPPYILTGRITDRLEPDVDRRSTFKLMIGTALNGLWIAGLAVTAAVAIRPAAAGLVVLAAAPVAVLSRRIRERWQRAWADAQSFMLLRSRREHVRDLREQQLRLAERLGALYQNATAEE
jgi:1-acyl-sn-glycerol-3-phosphate acyltransferase